MNFASWVILLVVIAIVALAIRSVFFKKESCCGCSHEDGKESPAKTDCASSGCSCDHCTSCQGAATARNTLQPTIKPLH